jgi:histidinol-phosphate aminotransferase
VVTPRVHGGPDAQGALPFDFSVNSNACGPCPQALAAVRAADVQRYPDPAYTVLRARLARLHEVEAWRVVPAASGSEFIFRLTAWAARSGKRSVRVPRHGYGDYPAAARAYGLELVTQGGADLAWACDPSSPLGQSEPAPTGSAVLALDLAYQPLRLGGVPAAPPQDAWQLWTPNKALGLAGVRGAYAIAPSAAQQMAGEVESLAPSWVLGAHGVAMLLAWCEPEVQRWLDQSRDTLRAWKRRQLEVLGCMGWQCLPSDTNFLCCHAGPGSNPGFRLPHLRAHGIQLRDCASFGLPGHVRLSVQPPAAQDALLRAWQAAR